MGQQTGGMAMQKVRLVTPTRRNTPSILAFEDELLNHFGWGDDIDYDVYAAHDGNSAKLQNKVNDAVGDNPAVIVSAGLMATGLLRTATALQLNPTPVIQAAGGDAPAPQANITGFKLNSLATANNHLTKFTGRNWTVTVLYNDWNTHSASVFSSLAAPGNVTIAALPIHDPAGLVRPAGAIDGFMVIPDAMFYRYHRKIVAMVEHKAAKVCYPERQFKNAHENKANVNVYGRHVPATFRLAAGYVNRILNGATVASLGGFKDAIEDNDP
jgi:hypothetical protein